MSVAKWFENNQPVGMLFVRLKVKNKVTVLNIDYLQLAGRDSPVRAEMPGNLQHYGR